MNLLDLFERLLARSGRGDHFAFDAVTSSADRWTVLRRLSVHGTRGVLARRRFGECSGRLLVGPRVKVLHGTHVNVGRNCILEADVEIVGLSKSGVTLADNVAIGRSTLIKPTSYFGRNVGEGCRVGTNSSIGPFGYIGCSGFIEIGSDVLIGPRVSMHAENHDYDSAGKTVKEQGVSRAPIVIKDGAWIGSDTVILAGVQIGERAVVGAGSVVTRDVPSDTVYGGVPARRLAIRDNVSEHDSVPRNCDDRG